MYRQLQHEMPIANIGDNTPNVSSDKKSRAWSKEEESKLQELVQKYGIGNWRKISMEMGNYGRSPNACDLHWYLVLSKNAYKFDDNLPRSDKQDDMLVPSGTKRRKWTDMDDQNLLHLVNDHGAHQQSWGIISAALGRTELAIRWRYNQLLQRNAGSDTQPTLNTSSQEGGANNANADNAYIQHILINQSDARKTAAGASSSKRRRWTAREDEVLQQLIESRGSDSWAVIASKLDTGRSHDACQYHWQYELCPKLVVQQQLQLVSADKNSSSAINNPSVIGDTANAASHVEGELADNELYLQQSGPLTTTDANFRAGEAAAKHVAPILSAHSYSSNSRTNEWYKWTPAEDNMLRQLIDTYGCSGQTAWERIAAQMPGRTLNSVRMRWKQALRPAVVAECLMGDSRTGSNPAGNPNSSGSSSSGGSGGQNEMSILAGLGNNNQANFSNYNSMNVVGLAGQENVQSHQGAMQYGAISSSEYV